MCYITISEKDFGIKWKYETLDEEKSDIFHSLTVKIIFLTKR